MSYLTRVTGEIAITPPLSWAEIKDSPYLDRNAHSLHLRVVAQSVDTEDGVLERRQAVAIAPWSDDSFKAYSIEEELTSIVLLHGKGHTFSGRFEGEGEENGDMWRLSVKDGKAHKVTPRIVWPEDGE